MFVQGSCRRWPDPTWTSRRLTTAIPVDRERMGGDPVPPSAPPPTPTRCCGSCSAGRRAARRSAERLVQRGPISGAGAMDVEEGRHHDPGGAQLHLTCGHVPPPRRHGPGQRLRPERPYDDENKSLNEGAHRPRLRVDGWYGRIFRRLRVLRSRQADRRFTKTELQTLLTASRPDQGRGRERHLRGPHPRIQKSHAVQRTPSRCSPTSGPSSSGRSLHRPARTDGSPGWRRGLLGGVSGNIAEACDHADHRPGRVDPLARRAVGRAAAGIVGQTMDLFVEIGLWLPQPQSTGVGPLSGGEAQRTRMIRHLGSSLTDVTYVFDEPTAGLHPTTSTA